LKLKDLTSLNGWRRAAEVWWAGIDGVEFTLSTGRTLLSASAREGSFTEGQVASGEASLDSVGLSLYQHPKGGWGWAPSGGVSYLSSTLRDLDAPPTQPPPQEGTQVSVVCQNFNSDGELVGSFKGCNLSNQYTLTLFRASFGVWGGYQWLSPTFFKKLKAHAELGAEWRPLSLRWLQSEIGGVEFADEWSWSWLGSARLIARARLLGPKWGLGGSVELEATPSVRYDEPVEFRGAERCDEVSCSRERAFVDELSLLSWSVNAHLIRHW
jgi:hypothetical protein